MKQRKKAKLPINDTPKKESEPLPIENKQNRTSREPGDASPPPRRIRRPVSIRRPKLVGKSVEGAAMQAVAASRKRASSNQFKNVGNAPLIKRPPTNQNVQDSTKASIGRPPIGKADQASKIPPHPLQTVRNQREHEERDETLLRAKDDFKMLCSIKHGGLRRLSALQRGATIMLANVWWPRKQNQTIPSTVAKFIVSKTPMAWSDACAFPLLPGETMVDMFVPVFSRWITTFTPGLEILPLVSTKASGTNSDSVFLSSGIRNVRGCKCLAVVKITKTPSRSVGHNIVRCEGWVLNLPRRSVEEQRSKLNANSTSLLSLEKDSAGMDKLTSDLHVSPLLYCTIPRQ